MKFFFYSFSENVYDDGTVELIIQFPAVLTLKPIQSMGHREMATGNCFGFFEENLLHFILVEHAIESIYLSFDIHSNVLQGSFPFILPIFFAVSFTFLLASCCANTKLFNNILPLSVNSSMYCNSSLVANDAIESKSTIIIRICYWTEIVCASQAQISVGNKNFMSLPLDKRKCGSCQVHFPTKQFQPTAMTLSSRYYVFYCLLDGFSWCIF